jgi:Tol biopolymer transport system component
VIYTISPDGGGRRTFGAGVDPAWSPSRRQIAFARDNNVYTSDAWRYDPRLVLRAAVAPTCSSFAPTWSPNGRSVVYETADHVSCGCPAAASWDVYSLKAINADGTHGRTLPFGTLDNGGTFDSTGAALPAWSPDGTRVAFVDYTADSEYIAFGRAATGSWHHILRTGSVAAADASRPDWQPS